MSSGLSNQIGASLFNQRDQINRDVEHSLITFQMLRFAAYPLEDLERAQDFVEAKRTVKIMQYVNTENKKTNIGLVGMPMALPPGVGEIVGYRLAESAGVGVANLELTQNEPTDFSNFVKRVPGGWAISYRVPDAIPLYFLQNSVSLMPPIIENGAVHNSLSMVFTALLDSRCTIIKASPVSRAAYDFPDIPPQPALDAARWDSDERLLTYAYRASLNCT